MVEPIALQDNLGKTPVAEKVTQIEKAQAELAQRDTAIVGRRKAIEHQSKPVPTDKTDEVIIHREQEQKQKRDKHEEKDKPEPEAQVESAPDQQKNEPHAEAPAKHLDVRA